MWVLVVHTGVFLTVSHGAIVVVILNCIGGITKYGSSGPSLKDFDPVDLGKAQDV